jgi:hypothetical protein
VIREDALRDALLASAESAKGHYIMLSSMLAEIQAVRETVRGLDPTFSEAIEHKRAQIYEDDAPIRREIIAGHDEIIRRLKAGEVC